MRNQLFRSKNGFAIVLGLSRAAFGSSWAALGSSEGPLDRPKRASIFILELSWAWFARLLLPKMALGRFWGHLWLVFGAPDGLLTVVLTSVKPISTITTAHPSFDILFALAVVVVVVSLLPDNFSSTRLGGMRGAIESARLLVLLLVRLLRLLLIPLLLHLLLLLTLLPHVLTKAGDGGVHAARRPG